MFNLYLDDVRVPTDSYTGKSAEGWTIVRSYDEFVKIITEKGLPYIISFDHDLADEHVYDYILNVRREGTINYDKYREKTGLSCAKWLVEYCMDKNLPLPGYAVHSANPIGAENIKSYLESYLKSRIE
jgi:hypothetical protein